MVSSISTLVEEEEDPEVCSIFQQLTKGQTSKLSSGIDILLYD